MNGSAGFVCPRCQCRHLPVVKTVDRGKFRYRTRRCRNCSTMMRCREEILQMVPPKPLDETKPDSI